jgi:MAF protein
VIALSPPSYLDDREQEEYSVSLSALLEVGKLLASERVVLASASPRRLEIMRMAGVEPEVHPVSIDEREVSSQPERHVSSLAISKAQASRCDGVTIAADTVVVQGDAMLGKPVSSEEAKAMLVTLSGRTHEVYTGVAVCFSDRTAHEMERTLVTFRELDETMINAYVRSGGPLDKAGAYGIQEIGERFVSRIEGCYFNVVGLPPRTLHRVLLSIMEGE